MIGDSPMDDQTVIGEVLAGDRDAYRAIVEKYGARVVRFCLSRMRLEEDALDAAQEVFIRAYSSLASFHPGGNFPSWLFAIAANHIRTRFRLFSADRRKIAAMRIEAASAASKDPVKEFDRSMRTEELRLAVSVLPSELRRPVELYYFAELSVGETARALGLGEEAIKSRLFRARKRIRQLLEHPQPEQDSRSILS